MRKKYASDTKTLLAGIRIQYLGLSEDGAATAKPRSKTIFDLDQM
jgi:hypothetical protein